MRTRILHGAITTVATLFGGLLFGLVLGDVVFHLIPGSSVEDVQIGHAVVAAIPAMAGFLAGGAAWGVRMGHLAGAPNYRRMAAAGMLGFGPITIFLAVILGSTEPAIVRAFEGLAIHRIFTLLFVPSAFLIAGISAYAVGIGLGNKELARSLFWRLGLAAGAAFLLVNLAMESLGWVVGAPGAAERATMVTVLAVGNIVAALVGGGLMGWLLAPERESIRVK